jgi:tetratricopeptide (TPR) repeat protein
MLTCAGAICLGLAVPMPGVGQESTNASPAANTNGTTEASASSDDALRAYLQLQEQIHEAQLTIERNRQESEEAAARNARAVSDRLQSLEQSLALQRAGELEAVQRANHTMVLVVSAAAVLGCLAILLTAYFQWRAVNRFTALAPALPQAAALGGMRPLAALEAGQESLLTIGTGEPVGARLLGALERLEKRIQELERTSRAPLNGGPAAGKILDLQSAGSAVPAETGEAAAAGEAGGIPALLGKGQSLLDMAKWEEAAACFDQVLALEPNNTEALVKKGTVLERLRRPQEALACYDRAIAVDGEMTIAYLYKGGLYNRLERFTEALECYERALQTQEKRSAS